MHQHKDDLLCEGGMCAVGPASAGAGPAAPGEADSLRHHVCCFVQEMALSALASIAGAAGAGFAPYVQPLMPALTHFMIATANELLPCR
jgi:hypothetical protein